MTKKVKLVVCIIIMAEALFCFSLIQPYDYVLAKELDGRVTDTEFSQSDTGTIASPAEHKAPSWFGAPDINAPIKENTAQSADIQPEKTNIDVTLDGNQSSNKKTDSDLKKLTAVTESDWQTKYWDGWWRRFDNAARRRIWLLENLHNLTLGDVSWGDVKLNVIVYKDGYVTVSIQTYDNSVWANIVANAYKNLAHTRTVKFPEWSQRYSVNEVRDIYVTHGLPKWNYKTGDYETVMNNR